MTFFSGTVQRVIFSKPEESFYILSMRLDGQVPSAAMSVTLSDISLDVSALQGPLVVVAGSIPGLTVDKDSWFGFEAVWSVHPKFGKQLKISQAPVLLGDWDAPKAEKMLLGCGVASSILSKILSEFGEKGFVAALSDPDKIASVKGITKFTAQYVSSRWETTQALFKGMAFLNASKIPSYQIKAVWKRFGERVEEVLTRNPWLLLEVNGIKFSVPDQMALNMGIPLDCPERLQGAVQHTSRTGTGMGHLYMTTGGMLAAVRKLIPEVTPKKLGASLVACHIAGGIVIDTTTKQGVKAIYDPWAYALETNAAKQMSSRMTTANFSKGEKCDGLMDGMALLGAYAARARPSDDLRKVSIGAVEDWAARTVWDISDRQKRGILNALISPVSIITGLPGTGKTTSLRALVEILDSVGARVLLLAPTGIAAKRLKAVTGVDAYTIHRAFEAQGSSEEKGRTEEYKGVISTGDKATFGEGNGSWGFDSLSPHSADVVIIDEASMVDQHLLFRLLDCTSEKCRIVLVGDAAQLPSVGPGNVLRDLVSSKFFPTVKLEEIFRQADTSQIVFAAHDVFAGVVPDTSISKEFCLIKCGTEDQILSTILKISKSLHGADHNFQVVSPKHKGTIGVTNLNSELRELLNPSNVACTEVKLAKGVIREGDKVMVIKNNYGLEVFNGDVGRVQRVDLRNKQVAVLIEGPRPALVHFEFRKVPKFLRLAYACTVHKMQGLEVDRIVMPLFDTFWGQLQRNLFYTAITRAKKQVILVGSHKAMARCVHNNKEDFRNTLLSERVANYFKTGVTK